MDRMQVRLFGRSRWWVAAGAALLWGGGLGSEDAFGQLRTGRSTSRDFYQEASATSPVRRVGTGLQDQNEGSGRTEPRQGVVQAACKSCVQGEEQGVVSGKTEPTPGSEIVVDDLDATAMGACGACGCADGDCGCDLFPRINIRLALPFANPFDSLSVRMEAATFWRDNTAIPALVRTGTGGAATDLFGGTVGMNEGTQGYRGEVAWRFGKDVCTSLQVRFFDAGAQSLTFDSVGTGASIPSIVRPYLDIPSNTQSSIAVRQPGLASGDLLAHATSDLYGGDILLKQIAYRSRCSKVDLLFGYQTAALSESIWVNSITNTPPIPATTAVLDLRDRFVTDNRFHGGVIGFSGITHAGRWSLSSMAKLGLGNMNRYVEIDGFQTVNSVERPEGGLHARATNEGTYRFDTFVVSPETNLTFGYRLTRRLEATLGYDYLLLPKVARVADQFDPQLAVNLSSSGDPRPQFTFRDSDLGVHSLNYGLQYRY